MGVQFILIIFFSFLSNSNFISFFLSFSFFLFSFFFRLTIEKDFNEQNQINKMVEQLSKWFYSLHALVIGPGLGRDEFMLKTVQATISEAIRIQLPLVIDGDGLFLIHKKPDIIRNHQNIILTPNVRGLRNERSE